MGSNTVPDDIRVIIFFHRSCVSSHLREQPLITNSDSNAQTRDRDAQLWSAPGVKMLVEATIDAQLIQFVIFSKIGN